MSELAAKKIFDAREAKGWTQEVMSKKLATALGQSYSLRQYQKLESGDFPKYKKEVVRQVEKLLGIQIMALIYEQNIHNEESSTPNNLVGEQGFFYNTSPRKRSKLPGDLREMLEDILANLNDLKNGQSQLWNQGQMIRQDVEGVSNYLMLKDAEWDPEKLKVLKDTYYKVVHAGPGKV